jgi:hypothetical protein
MNQDLIVEEEKETRMMTQTLYPSTKKDSKIKGLGKEWKLEETLAQFPQTPFMTMWKNKIGGWRRGRCYLMLFYRFMGEITPKNNQDFIPTLFTVTSRVCCP